MSGIRYDAEGGSTGAYTILTRPFALLLWLRCVGTDFVHEITLPLKFDANFSHGEADGIRRLPHRWHRAIDSLGNYFEAL